MGFLGQERGISRLSCRTAVPVCFLPELCGASCLSFRRSENEHLFFGCVGYRLFGKLRENVKQKIKPVILLLLELVNDVFLRDI